MSLFQIESLGQLNLSFSGFLTVSATNMSGQSYKFFKSRVPLANDGDDSITEVAQSPKRVLEVDLTNSPHPVVTTKLIPRTRPTPNPPLGASSEAPVKEGIDDSVGMYQVTKCLIE